MADREEIYAALEKHFGFSSFRDGQYEIISAILDGRDTLSVMPTGAGKSLCFQLPAVLSEGTTLVISPLISLMKDQILSLRERGIKAATVNSSESREKIRSIMKNAAYGAYRLLYVAPERINTDDFLQLIKKAHNR